MLTTIEKILFLNSVDVFKDLSIDDLMTIASIAEEERYPDHTILCREGDEGDSLFLIVKGRVSITKDFDKDKKLIAIHEDNQCVGEMAILTDEPRSATVETLEDTNCLVIDKRSFKEIIKKHPEIAFSIFNVLASRLRDVTGRLAELTTGEI